MKRLTKEEFIEKANKIHNNKYIYTEVDYINIHTKVCIICPIHGAFWQSPNKHIHRKQGCPFCNGGIKGTLDEFKLKAYLIHGDKYGYDNFLYVNKNTKSIIHCNNCGRDFKQTPDAHINGRNGCPFCKQSKMEEIVEIYLEHNNIPFIYQANKDHLPWLKTIRGSFSLDFYFPQYQMAIECQGEQHYNTRQNGIFTEERVKLIKKTR